MEKLSYTANTNLYNPSDLKGILKTTMRERFKAQDLNFGVWKDQVVIKLPRDALFNIIRKSMSGTVLYTSYSAFNVEFYEADPEPLPNQDLVNNRELIRVDVQLNYDENGYEAEPVSADKSTQEILVAYIEVYGLPSAIDNFTTRFKKNLREEQEAGKSSLVNWVFNSDDGAREKTFQIKKSWDMDRSYYPWIESSLREYYQFFMDSRAQILVLYGPPGTGKTSFIRDLICEMNLNAYISYDLKILTSDSTFVNYVTGSIFDAIVIEDADDLLTAERGEQNKVIAKILNVSDGLIKLPKKKLIFSTNLNNVGDIDPAIIRPGRCFDVMEFRELTKPEAEQAAKVLGVTAEIEKQKYSLAELFFMKDVQECSDPLKKRRHGLKKTKIGFY